MRATSRSPEPTSSRPPRCSDGPRVSRYVLRYSRRSVQRLGCPGRGGPSAVGGAFGEQGARGTALHGRDPHGHDRNGRVRGEPLAPHQRAHALALIGLDVEEREVGPVLRAARRAGRAAGCAARGRRCRGGRRRSRGPGSPSPSGWRGGTGWPAPAARRRASAWGTSRRTVHIRRTATPQRTPRAMPMAGREDDPRPGARRLQDGEADDAQDEHEHGGEAAPDRAGPGPALEGAAQHGEGGHVADREQRQQREEAGHPDPERQAQARIGRGGRERARPPGSRPRITRGRSHCSPTPMRAPTHGAGQAQDHRLQQVGGEDLVPRSRPGSAAPRSSPSSSS